MKSGVYQIVNKQSGKRYIGSSKDVLRRLQGHLNHLLKDKHPNRHLQNSFNFYGQESFTFEFVESCHQEDRLVLEQTYIDAHKRSTLYNSVFIAGAPTGYRHTEEAKERIGAFWKGKKRGPLSDRTKMSLSASLKGKVAWNKKVWPRCICLFCGSAFLVRPYKIKEGKGKFCSKQCTYDSFRGRSFSLKSQFQRGLVPWNKKLIITP